MSINRDNLSGLGDSIFPNKHPNQNISSVFREHNIVFSTNIENDRWRGTIYSVDNEGKPIRKYSFGETFDTQKDCYMALVCHALTLV